MRSLLLSIAAVCALTLSIIITGCSESVYTGLQETNRPPEVWLSSGPVEQDTTGYQVHFYWSGWDPDGEIDHFEFCILDGDPIGYTPADTMDADNWYDTSAHDSIFRVSADGNPRPYENNDYPNMTVYDMTHTFFLRAVDLQGKRSTTVSRSFTATTLAPTCQIECPIGSVRDYSTVISFCWTGSDPVDSPTNTQDPDSIRYMWSLDVDPRTGLVPYNWNIIADMNEHPEMYEEMWGPWIWYRAGGDSGRSTILGDDEILVINERHIFAVQAKDEAGAVTAVFVENANVRKFRVTWKAGPGLTISEPFLGSFRFVGTNLNAILKELPPGVPLNFKWEATAAEYGAEIVGYRYGWDVSDINNPTDWAVPLGPYKTAPTKTLYAGTHSFLVESRDNSTKVTRGEIIIEIIPFSMERNLFFVDDFASDNVVKPLKQLPTETELDNFWLDICSRTVDFRSDRDIYDVAQYNGLLPKIRTVGKYKNIIWDYSPSTARAWRQIILYIPESQINQGTTIAINYLSIFLAKGGHLLTCGMVDRGGGGLTDAFPIMPLLPAVIKYDMALLASDTSAVNSMPYKDYCVRIVDKVDGQFYSGDEMAPNIRRDIARDAMRYAYVDPTAEALKPEYTAFPDSLDLWSEITKPGLFFDPQVRGFTYVEVYDPQYWMDFKLIPFHLGCYQPLYRMKSRNSLSPLQNQTVALVLKKYGNIEPEVSEGVAVAANSFHFGFPLWFFDRGDINKIFDVIFTEWEIKE